MEFECSKCHAKYIVPAERIKDRILKIKCRNCGNLIEIRGDAVIPEPEGSKNLDSLKEKKQRVESESLLKRKFQESFSDARPIQLKHSAKDSSVPVTAGAPDGSARGKQRHEKAEKLLELARKAELKAAEMKEADKWYVAIKSSPVGPVNKAKIRYYIRRGELTLSSLVWREGFSDWKQLQTVPELRAIFFELQNEIGKPHQIDIAARLKRVANESLTSYADLKLKDGVVLTPSDGSYMQKSEKESYIEATKNKVSPALESSSEPVSIQFGKQISSVKTSPLAAEGDEDVIGEALKGFYVGRIDSAGGIPELEAARPSYFGDVLQMPSAQVGKEGIFEKLLHSSLFLFIGGALALLAGFLIMVATLYFWEKKNKKKPEVKIARITEKKHESEAVKSKEEGEQGDILAGLIITVEEVMEMESASSQGSSNTASGAGKKKKGSREPAYKTTVMEMPDIKEHSIAGSDLKKKVQAMSDSDGKYRNGLSDDVIKGVVSKNSKTIQRCYEKVLGRGMGINEQIRVKVQVKVGTSGKVTKVKVMEITKYGNFLTPCIESGIQTWVFPKADDPSEFIFPVLLTPKT